MASPDQLKAAQQESDRQVDLTAAYVEFSQSFVYRDLIEYLKSSRDSSQNVAGSEMENMNKKALYLQDSYAYGKVIAYIEDKLSM